MDQEIKDLRKEKTLYRFSNLRKINAAVSLLSTLLIVIHGGYDAFWMFFRGKIPTLPKVIAIILMITVLIHIILSITIIIFGIKESKGKKGKLYKKQNIKTLLQRIFGILMLVLIPLHGAWMWNRLSPKILHSFIHTIFFIAVYGHIAISTSKAFITLGLVTIGLLKWQILL